MKINPAVFHQSLHLSDEQLLPENNICPFCGGSEREAVCSLQKKPEVVLLKCNICHACSTSRVPTASYLDQYYRDYYVTNNADSLDTNVTIETSGRLARHIFKSVVNNFSKEKIRILDYGGGDGTISVLLAKLLLARNYTDIHITIVDYGCEPITSDIKGIFLVYQESLDDLIVSDERFDLVIASAVIEHLPYPAHIMQQLLGLLNNDGVFYARTPYKEPFAKLLALFGIGFDLSFPAHLHDLGQEFWEFYFENNIEHHNYQILSSRPSLVSKSLRTHFLTAIVSWLLKMPWYLFGNKYRFVGGWEVVVRK